jgi:HNH endonuclease
MRCFYCAGTGKPASEEHIPSQFLGSRLKTRRVCRDCNARAAREIDGRFADYLMVKMPKALADVRSIKHQGKEPSFETDATISATGERVRVRFTPRGREVRRPSGEKVHDVIEVQYGLDSDLWVQFNAKVALRCAAKLFPDEWLDEPLARALRK